jgi:hypothetical protein
MITGDINIVLCKSHSVLRIIGSGKLGECFFTATFDETLTHKDNKTSTF